MRRLFVAVGVIAIAVVAGLSHKGFATCGIDRAIIHINGIQTTRNECRGNLQHLIDVYGSTFSGQAITYDYAYNGNNGSLWSSLAEVFFQMSVEDDPVLATAVALGILGDFSRITDPTLKSQLKTAYANLVAQNSTAPAVMSKTATIAAKVNSYLTAGSAVLLVPHSQGSLYANSVFEILTGGTSPSRNMKITAVATPAANIAGDTSGTSYVTASEDGIINALRVRSFFSGWTVLPSNVNAFSLGQSPPDGIGHSFAETYLNPSYAAWPLLKQKLDAAMGTLQPADKALISATWDPSYPSIEYRMMVNGLDVVGVSGSDPNLSTGAGWGNYCAPLATSFPTTYTPKVVNRGFVPHSVTVSGPLGSQTATVAAQNGILPGMFFGPVLLVQNGAVSRY